MRKSNKREKRDSISSLKKKADRLHSIKVRQANGVYARCYTCGVKKRWQELQCGHFISRSCNQLRYDERNTKPQCVACNVFKHGNIPEFAAHLIKDYGPDIIKQLTKESRAVKQFTIKELQKICS